VVLLTIPQVRPSSITPGALASLDRLARAGAVREAGLGFPGLTGPAFATLVTGASAARHGIVGSAYFDRGAGRVVPSPLSAAEYQVPPLWARLGEVRPGGRAMLWFVPHRAPDGVAVQGWLDPDGEPRFEPAEVGAELQRQFGPFPSNLVAPLVGAPRLDFAAWVLRSAAAVIAREQPDLAVVRVPHLGHVARRFGPDGRSVARAVSELDRLLGPFLASVSKLATVLVVTETVATPVGDPVDVTRQLRRRELVALREHPGGGLDIDLSESAVVPVVDNQVCHLYLNDRERAGEVVALFSREDDDGIEWVVTRQQRVKMGLDHPRAGDVVLVSDPDRWFRGDWWRTPGEAPRGLPCPSGLDAASLNQVNDAGRVRGSLGSPLRGGGDRGVLILSRPPRRRLPGVVASQEVAGLAEGLLRGEL
jgi:hypothetical protein